MKIIKLTTENIKKVVAVEITPKGNVVKISGKNGQGKTSVLDSIWWALGGLGNVQDTPIRSGQKKAKIRIELDDLIIERKFTAKTSTLTVMNKDKTPHTSPQSVIDALLGKLTFDPLAFTRLSDEKQYNTLAGVCGLEDTLLAAENNVAGERYKRKEANREVKRLTALVDSAEQKVKVSSVDTAKLSDRIAELSHQDDEQSSSRNSLDNLRKRCKDLINEKSVVMANLARIEKDLKLNKQYGRELASLVEAFPSITEEREALLNEIADSSDTNKRAAAYETYKINLNTLGCQECIVSLCNKRIDELQDDLTGDIQKTKLPIKGLSFSTDTNKVLYKGIEFSQASSAEQLKVSTAIAMSENPELRIIRITDGSLLDEDSMKVIEKMAEKHDYQVWMECVDSTGQVGFYIEEGEVKEVNDD